MNLQRHIRAYVEEQTLFDAVNELIAQSFTAYDPLVDSFKKKLIDDQSLKSLQRRFEKIPLDSQFIVQMAQGILFGLKRSFITGASQVYDSIGISKPIVLKDGFSINWNLFDQRAKSWMEVQSFTIAGTENLNLLNSVQTELGRAIAAGDSVSAWRERVDTLFDRAGVTRLGRHHAYTVFQTNMHSAYNSGRFYAQMDPDVREEFPLWEYVAVMDDNTRPAHADMHGKQYPPDDPIWAEWYPENGFNCRCMVLAVHKSEGGSASRFRPGSPDQGFGFNPALSTRNFENYANRTLEKFGLDLDNFHKKIPRCPS